MSDSSSQVRGLEWLKVTGSAYIDRIKAEHPLFLSDIPVDEQELEALFAELSRFNCVYLSDEGRACLAVAAIGSAVHASEQDAGFREQFFRRFGMKLTPEWDSIYGPQILRFLMDYFDEIDRPGPFRYVRAVYRHAGISQRALPAFARFLKDLRNRCGFDYSNWQYRQLLDKVTSRFARDFLNTDAGYEFARSVTRILEDVDRGCISVGQLEHLPGFRRGFWTALLECLGDQSCNRRQRRNFPVPVLALDVVGQRLVLRFDEDGIARRSYTMNGRQPIFPYERIRHEGQIFGSIFHPNGDVEPWELDPWVPTRTTWAVFRGSDGVFVAAEGRVPPGSYYLVAEDTVLPDDLVEEDCGCLDWESHDVDGQPYRVWRILLRPGTQVESIGLKASAADTIPSLEYLGLRRESEFGADVFMDRLPPIRVKNWTESSSKYYRILLDRGNGSEEIDQRIRDDQLFLAIQSPAVGRILIEPRGRIRHSEIMLPELRFHVIPGPLKFQFPKVAIGENDSAEVSLVSPKQWEIKWTNSLVELGPRRWAIPARTRVIEGTATLEGHGVPIALRVKRCSLSIFPTRSVPNVFWGEDANENIHFLIEGVPDAPCSLLLLTEKDSIALCSLGILGPSGLATVRSLEFRDYLLQSTIPCAEFAILAGKQVVRTGRFLLAAKHIPKLLQCADNECPYFGIPSVGASLKALWSICRSPQTEVEFESRLTGSHLGPFLADIALTANVLDGTKINLSGDQLRPFATPRLLTLLDSIRAAKAEMSCTDIPNVDVNLVPLDRWREAVTLLIEQQHNLKDAQAIVREWRSEICSGFQVEYQSRMCRRTGGRDLTQAAIKYRAAVINSNVRAYDAAYGTLRRVVDEQPDLLVRAVALGLLQLTLYRSGRPTEAAELSGSNLPKGFERLGAQMNALSALCKGALRPKVALPSGVGFEDLSPVEEDRRLLQEKNQLVEGIPREKREGSV
jgi:hypothetical protein